MTEPMVEVDPFHWQCAFYAAASVYASSLIARPIDQAIEEKEKGQ